ncbi:MAG: hypothetical protein KDD50_07840 [Bdellovibrionales bacterium]|nr:hypothetical protein [Bdellovibrionales bacterium]
MYRLFTILVFFLMMSSTVFVASYALGGPSSSSIESSGTLSKESLNKYFQMMDEYKNLNERLDISKRMELLGFIVDSLSRLDFAKDIVMTSVEREKLSKLMAWGVKEILRVSTVEEIQWKEKDLNAKRLEASFIAQKYARSLKEVISNYRERFLIKHMRFYEQDDSRLRMPWKSLAVFVSRHGDEALKRNFETITVAKLKKGDLSFDLVEKNIMAQKYQPSAKFWNDIVEQTNGFLVRYEYSDPSVYRRYQKYLSRMSGYMWRRMDRALETIDDINFGRREGFRRLSDLKFYQRFYSSKDEKPEATKAMLRKVYSTVDILSTRLFEGHWTIQSCQSVFVFF